MPQLHRYKLAGLNISSDFPLHHISKAPSVETTAADVAIRAASDEEMGSGWVQQVITPNSVPADIRSQPLPELRMRVTGGNTVLVHCTAPIAESELSVYLTGLAWGYICHQRGLLPLHCSAVEKVGRSFAFTGESGAGKSTLQLGLTRRGYFRCCDDIMVVSPGGTPSVHPTPSGTKLWEDAVAYFGEDQIEPLRLRGDRQKFRVAAQDSGNSVAAPLPLAALYVLENGEGRPRITLLSGYEAWSELYKSIYRIDMVPWINSRHHLASGISDLARSVPIFRFVRPLNFACFEDGLDLLEQHMASLLHEELSKT